MRVDRREKPGEAPKGFDTIVFEQDGFLVEVNMPEAMAKEVEQRMAHTHGLTHNGKLSAIFEDAADRDYCRDMLEDIWPSGDFEEVTL